jgi:hypothetical protein
MKKLFLIIAIVFVGNVFISCTDLDNELIETEISATGGEEGQDPDDDDDDNSGGGN